MGEKVTFKITTQAKIDDNQVPIVNGQLIFVPDTAKIYLDYKDVRTCYTPSVSPSTDGMNYIGIMDDGFDPKTSSTWKIDGNPITPNPKDIAVYGKKEYMWRKGKDGITYGWYEIGDEDSPEWYDDTDKPIQNS